MNEIYAHVGQQILVWWLGVGAYYFLYARPRGRDFSFALNFGWTLGMIWCVYILSNFGALP